MKGQDIITSKSKKLTSYIGPGTLVTAAFIGPGTITTCIRIGIENRYALLWAVVFATLSTIILQETAARIGIVTQNGLGENIHSLFNSRILRCFAIVLVFSSILIGNCAFETGNITGVSIGLQMIFPNISGVLCSIVICALSLLMINFVKFKNVQRILVICVFLMSIVFLTLAIASQPTISDLHEGIDKISLGKGGLMNILGLIGTTIGPYGLFLHSYAASKKWSNPEDIKHSNIDTIISISIGGIITAAIIIVSAASVENDKIISVSYVSDLTDNLVLKWGYWTKYLLSVGLILAGFSSCLTAPIGAAVATQGICGISSDFTKKYTRILASSVVIAGTFFSILWGASPTQLILFAQIINAVILPLIASFLLICANSKRMGKYKNTPLQNIEGVIVIVLCVLICIRNIVNIIT